MAFTICTLGARIYRGKHTRSTVDQCLLQCPCCRLGEVYSWNYTTQSPYFPGECGRIRGAAEFFPPNRDRTFVQLYNPDLCRTIKLDFARESKTKNGNVSGYVYEVTPEVFANSSVNPDNACFEGDSHHQLPGGVFNASACRFGAPIFMSQPHFFQADPFYLQQVSYAVQSLSQLISLGITSLHTLFWNDLRLTVDVKRVGVVLGHKMGSRRSML